MRKTKFSSPFVAVLFASFFALCVFVSCNQIDKGHTPRENKISEQSYAMRSIQDFSTVDIDKEIPFKMGEQDGEDASIKTSYRIGQKEVTRDLWAHVYNWATNEKERGGSTYRFSKGANIGNVTSDKMQPMVNVTFMDAVVWCNAYTEYLNFLNQDNTKWVDCTPVYYQYSDEAREALAEFARTKEEDRRAKYTNLLSKYVLRVAGEPQDSKTGMEFNEFHLFDGYRLPTVEEWEFASRLTKTASASYDTTKTVNINGASYHIAKGVCLSGSAYSYADTSATAQEENAKVASNFDKLLKGPLPDSDNPPEVKGLRKENDIGCFDMSGGVWEWTLPDVDRHIVLKKSGKVFILDDNYPKVSQNPEGINRKKGGSYLSKATQEYAIGFVGKFPMKSDDAHKEKWQRKDIGFRMARTLQNIF